ncbi:MAG: hypothetical protein GY835_21060 [bacterium]|nr:hypothetical protein [bacterium]
MAQVFLILMLATGVEAQDEGYVDDVYLSNGETTLDIIDSPTAQVLRNGEYRLGCRLMAMGSVIAHADVGIQDRVSIGVSWGMTNLLGRDDVETYENTGLSVRLLLVQEMQYPGIAIGFTNQGYGHWYESLERYERKSKGFYACATRHWYGPWDTEIVTTGGINYSLEKEDESSVDAFFGLEQTFDGQFSLLVDYSLGLNDSRGEDEEAAGFDSERRFGDGLGWLDFGLCWTLEGSLELKFVLRDLLSNYRDPATGKRTAVDRQFMISYVGSF